MFNSSISTPCCVFNKSVSQYIGNYRQTSNVSHTLVGNKIVDHSTPTTTSFST